MTLLRWITLVSILFWLVVYWQAGRKVLVDIKESIRSRNSYLDPAFLILMTLCSLVIVGVVFLASFGYLKIAFLQNLAVVSTGTLLSVSGVIGMFYCRYYLGKFWTAENKIVQEHQIIDTGPYHLARHPIYTFAILMYVGFGLVFLSQWSTPLAATIIVMYILKAKEEDAFLEKNLRGYWEYKLQVRYYLVPGLW